MSVQLFVCIGIKNTIIKDILELKIKHSEVIEVL